MLQNNFYLYHFLFNFDHSINHRKINWYQKWYLIYKIFYICLKKQALKKMNEHYSKQRKTTLKWKVNGDLSEIDMLRILEKLSNNELKSCEITCNIWKIDNHLFINKSICWWLHKIKWVWLYFYSKLMTTLIRRFLTVLMYILISKFT